MPSPLSTTHTENMPLDHHIILDSGAGSPSRSLWERRNRNPRKAPSLPAPPRRRSPGYSGPTYYSPRKGSAPELSPLPNSGRGTPSPTAGGAAEVDSEYHASAAMTRSASDTNSATAPRSLRPRVDGRAVIVPATHRDDDVAMESPTDDRYHQNNHDADWHAGRPVIEHGLRSSDRHPVLDTPRASASGREQRNDDGAMTTPRGSHHESQHGRRPGPIVSRNGSSTPSLPSALPSAMGMHRYSVASGPRSAISSGARAQSVSYESPSGELAVRSPRVFSEARGATTPYSRSSTMSPTSSYPATPSGLAIHQHLIPRAPPGSPRNFSPRTPMSPAMPSPALDHIPKDFVIQRLNKFAGTFWCNLSTSDVRLLVPFTKHCEDSSHIPFPPTPAVGNMRAEQAAGGKPKERVRAVPVTPTPASAGSNRPALRTLAFEVHRDYLVQQSSLIRTVLSEGPKQASSIEMRGCRLLASEPGAPIDIIVPLPDPSSFGILLHWMYWGDLESLETALNENPLKWKGMIANVNFLGLDQRTKLTIGRWWRRWAAPSVSVKTRPADRDSIINDDPHICSPEIRQEPVLHSDDPMMDSKPNRQLLAEADEVSERLRML
ncbi:hypothetical protein Q8F55_001095 [Vanrija albida]|uniref:BTB domain-containing protein n=1 Tax=Vanrija albida TaxID=181172 RepID=A0ABR3QF43_9TREE